MNQTTNAALAAQFAQALDALRAQGERPSVAIAYSGGLDSSVLLHLAAQYSSAHDVPLSAFHVHHGISPNADAWLAHCEATCARLGVPFAARRVVLEKTRSGVEAAARKLRYAALGALCADHGVRLMLTAHHLDDQAETVLLQLLRGSGTAGLSGMDAANAAPELLGNPDLVMARPLLPVSRQQLEAYAAAHDIAWVEDESNTHPRYARNALRHQVMPALAAAFPGYQERFARSAAHAQSAQRLLTELAVQDLAACLVDDCIDVAKLRAMSLDRAYNMLRYWFGLRALRMPSTAWLTEMVTQLVEARHDAQLLVTHPDCHIRRHRDLLHITPKLADLAGQRDPDDEGIFVKEGERFAWTGEASMAFPAYGGVLHFDPAQQGFDSAWLRAQPLQIDFRKGGERLKPAANRPTRPLKYHYQACNVPAWERERLPVVSSGKDLLFAAGIGMDCHHFGSAPASLISLRWEAHKA
ncbi:tRNA lysidine(34) synthetase TilS [Massilia antarctica]|uniref:tRNA lysidine(34) synthetase TilS n=1 Tax=Massilia antarctica TaxID=2765360 RepID=UPI0006BCA812|nr:tRNA lysidine(34) synthetase TilS [Massilia sp. H27-R4]CUI08950.1 tRNA(Ile)-lysidine synthetase [Janthinobacterium sp. CG23_2]CUU32736.1 tRNA(Ile)-lysidine synthetase [Janthinobacterium sp. CG23_2]